MMRVVCTERETSEQQSASEPTGGSISTQQHRPKTRLVSESSRPTIGASDLFIEVTHHRSGRTRWIPTPVARQGSVTERFGPVALPVFRVRDRTVCSTGAVASFVVSEVGPTCVLDRTVPAQLMLMVQHGGFPR